VGLTAFQEMNRMEDEYLDTVLISKTITRKISPYVSHNMTIITIPIPECLHASLGPH
jgi:hypothetical protein